MDRMKAFFTPKSKRNKLRLTLPQEVSWENTDTRDSSSASNEELKEQQKHFESLSIKVTSVSPKSPLSTSPVPNHFTFDFSFQPNSNHLIRCSSQTVPSSPVRKWGMLSSSPLPSVQLRPRVGSTDLRTSASKSGSAKISESKISKFPVDAVTTSSPNNARTSPKGGGNSKQHSSYESTITSTNIVVSHAGARSPLINEAVPQTINNTTPKQLNSTMNASEKESRSSKENTSTPPNVNDQKCVQSEVCNIHIHDTEGSVLKFSDATKQGCGNRARSKNRPSYIQLEKSNIQADSVYPTEDHEILKCQSPPNSVKTHALGEKSDNIRNDGASSSLGFTEAVSSDQSSSPSTNTYNLPQDHRFRRIMELDDYTRQMLEIDIIRPLCYL